MSEPKLLSLRLPADLLDRLDALVPAVDQDSELVAVASAQGAASRSLVLRLALVEGVKVLEARYGKATRKPKR